MSTAGAVKATSIGAYQLVRKIGEGGMGEVWEAEHQMIGRRAAIKFLLPSFTTVPSTVERFFNEARAVAVVADPGIIQIYDYGREGDQAYIVMELLEGDELSSRLKRLGRLAAIDVIRLSRQIASSLAAVHDKGVIHRDLKPDNIFIVGDPAVTGGERTKILDFGIAKLTQHDSQFKTQTGAMVGTPTYMSPEQCRATPIDHRSDIYSLGVMMFVMVCGRPPFEGEGSGDVLIGHVRDAAPTPSSIYRDVPRELETIIMRCLEKQPDARYQTAADLNTALAKAETLIASRAAFEPTAEIVVTYDSAPAPRRSKRGLVIGGTALAVIGAVVGIVLVTQTPSTTTANTAPSTTSPSNTTTTTSPSTTPPRDTPTATSDAVPSTGTPSSVPSAAKTSTAKTSTAKSSTAKTSTAKTSTAKTSTAKTSTAKSSTVPSTTPTTTTPTTATKPTTKPDVPPTIDRGD